MNYVISLLILSAFVVACNDSPASDVVLTVEAQFPGVSSNVYRRHCQSDSHGGTRAYVLLGDGNLIIATGDDEAVPSTEVSITLTTTLPTTGVQIGTNSSGNDYVIVASADYAYPKSELVYFEDTDGDGLPEQDTRVLLCAVMNAGFCCLSLDRVSSVGYVLDGPGQRVFRITDSDSNAVPDTVAIVPFVASSQLGHPAGSIAGAAEHSVKIGLEDDSDVPSTLLVLEAVDTDEDGDADSLVEVPFGGLSTTFANVPRDGETSVLVKSNVGGSFVIEDEAGATLASFLAENGVVSVTLSRSLIENEQLEIAPAAGGAAVSSVVVLDSTTVRVGHLGGGSAVLDGGQLEIYGANFTGQEFVEVILDEVGQTQWHDATLVSSTSDRLTVSLPELGISESKRIVIRVSNNATEREKLRSFFKRVIPD